MNEFSIPNIAEYEAQYSFSLASEEVPPMTFSHHVHNKIEFYVLLEGDASFSVEASVYKLNAGDAVVIKPNEMHNCILNSKTVHKHLCFWFDCENEFLFGDFTKHDFGTNNLISPSAENRERLLYLYGQLQIATTAADKHRLFYLTLEILDIFRKSLSSSSSTKPLPPLLKNILSDIDLHFKNEIHINELAKKYYISHSTLTRLFRTHLHTTPKQYIEAKRLAYSRRLLKKGASVVSACLESGFTDCSNYIRLFKKNFNVTPNQYKNS